MPVTVDHRLIASHNDAVPTTLELDDAEKAALIALLKQTIAVDPFPLSLRSRTFNGLMTGIVPLGATSPAQQAVDPYYSPVLSFSGFTSETLVQLASDLQHEVDPARLPQVYVKWSDYVLDQAWASAVATSPPTFVMAPRVNGLELTQLEMLDYTNVSIDG